ncbi:MAG: RNase adapter RapZ [Acidobacteria bacterium]|nr:RNase adapter RapZ [Acidobacteriota bacterium]MBV9474601.1 RNase adapter RapZ [Acidobacteriota bacterium]
MNAPEYLVVITGLSGSGKSYVQSTLEDLGFYCSDNLPIELIEPYLNEVSSHEKADRVSIVVDVRTHDFATIFPNFYRERLQKLVPNTVLIFLEASEEVIARRYSETRRPHPLAKDRPLIDAIQAERAALTEVKSLANMVLDTSQFSVHELKAEIMRRFQLPGQEPSTLVTIITFGFKYSLPYNLDLLFDVRFLPNPHFVDALRPKTGVDPEVVAYLEAQEGYAEFYRRLFDFVSYVLPGYRKEMKSYLTIGIGCTGGKHRSVAIGQRLGNELAGAGYAVEIVHRDMNR